MATDRAIEKIVRLVESGDLAIVEHLIELEEKLEAEIPHIKDVISRVKGDKGDKGECGETGPKGERGEKGDRGEQGPIGPQGPQGVQGQKGYDGKDGVDGKDGKDGVDGSLKDLSPEEIRNSLELLRGDERLDKTAIKGLDALDRIPDLERMTMANANYVRIGVSKTEISNLETKVNRQIGYADDLTEQCNGVLKEFTLDFTPVSGSVMVYSTQFPTIFRPSVDYTVSGNTLSLTSEVGAPQTGQTLVAYYTKS